MRIGFDAKRAFFNRSGLGNYSRDTIRSLFQHFPGNDFFLYTPSTKNALSWKYDNPNLYICTSSKKIGKIGQAYWRSFLLNKRLQSDSIDLYHGLSNELPYHLEKTGIKSVVTIHDLIFMRHPEWYKPVDRLIYRKKFNHSSRIADRVVTVSRQTQRDLVNFFEIEERKIEVVYQDCNDAFKIKLTSEEKKEVRRKWNLPKEYILYVGTVEERKNLFNVVKAIYQDGIAMPLVVVGRHTSYARQVQSFIRKHSLKYIYFLKEVPVTDLPGIYQMADVFIYPSLFEGFGIPILEALFSGVPVITSKGGCFDEVGGDTSFYVDPLNTPEIGAALKKILTDTLLHQKMKEAGYKHAKLFSGEKSAQQLMNLYTNLLNE